MPTSSRSISSSWFVSAFDELYPLIYAHRTVDAAAPESAFAIGITELQPGDRALDLACGNGRHMLHLLNYAEHVTGLDFSPQLLIQARKILGDRGQLVRADMRALPFVNQYDVVFNFFTSFGYFMDEAENVKAGRNLAKALRPRGRFFMDYMNPTQVRESLVSDSERVEGRYRILDRRWIDEIGRRVNKSTKVFRDQECVADYSESVRIYELEEITGLLQHAGLEVRECFGDYDGSAYRDGKPRMILTGTKSLCHG